VCVFVCCIFGNLQCIIPIYTPTMQLTSSKYFLPCSSLERTTIFFLCKNIFQHHTYTHVCLWHNISCAAGTLASLVHNHYVTYLLCQASVPKAHRQCVICTKGAQLYAICMSSAPSSTGSKVGAESILGTKSLSCLFCV